VSNEKQEWLPLDLAAERFGYNHAESLRRRLRQLRALGYVVDIGRPASDYPARKHSDQHDIVVIMWPNPKTALIRSDAPAHLLNPKPGKRARRMA
jgi:hypothetical protein